LFVQGGKFSLLQKIHQLPRPEWMGFFQIVHLILKKNPFCAETGANFCKRKQKVVPLQPILGLGHELGLNG
jgi:hypothetical protein